MGGRARLRLDDPLAASRARLRSPHRRLRGHHPRRHGRQSAAPKRPSVSFQTDSKDTDEQNYNALRASFGPNDRRTMAAHWAVIGDSGTIDGLEEDLDDAKSRLRR